MIDVLLTTHVNKKNWTKKEFKKEKCFGRKSILESEKIRRIHARRVGVCLRWLWKMLFIPSGR
jgi:hypothetical protein